MSAKSIKIFQINEFGQDLNTIREIAKPIWMKFLNTEGIGPRAVNQLGWNFGVFVEELALSLRVADQNN